MSGGRIHQNLATLVELRLRVEKLYQSLIFCGQYKLIFSSWEIVRDASVLLKCSKDERSDAFGWKKGNVPNQRDIMSKWQIVFHAHSMASSFVLKLCRSTSSSPGMDFRSSRSLPSDSGFRSRFLLAATTVSDSG